MSFNPPNPFSADPSFGNPYQASYNTGPQFSMSSIYSDAGNLQTATMNRQHTPRRAMSDMKASIERAAIRESVYGPLGDQRIPQASDSLNAMGVVTDESHASIMIMRKAEQARRRGDKTFKFSSEKDTEVGGISFKTGEEQELNVNSIMRNTEMRDRAQRARIQVGTFIKSGLGAKLYGRGFGNAVELAEAGGDMAAGVIARQQGVHGTPGSLEEMRSRGVMQRDLTSSLMEGMQNSQGGFNQDFGDIGTASQILKSFAAGGGINPDEITKEIQDAAGGSMTTVDPSAIKSKILPKVKMMVDTLDTLKDIYGEMEPEKLMRIASEVTGLNVNDIRNAKDIQQTVGRLSKEAESFGMSQTGYMDMVVGGARSLSQYGYGQQSAGILSQQFAASAGQERFNQERNSDISKGGFRAMSTNDIMRRNMQMAGGFLRDKSGQSNKIVGLMEVLQDNENSGGKILDENTKKRVQEALQSGDSEGIDAIVNTVSQETGININRRRGDVGQRLQQMGGEGDFKRYMTAAMTNNNADAYTKRFSEERGWHKLGLKYGAQTQMLGRTMSALGTEELSDIFTSFSEADTPEEKEKAMKVATGKLMTSEGFQENLRTVGLGKDAFEDKVGNYSDEDVTRIQKQLGLDDNETGALKELLNPEDADTMTDEAKQTQLTSVRSLLGQVFAENLGEIQEQGGPGLTRDIVRQRANLRTSNQWAAPGRGMDRQAAAAAAASKEYAAKEKANKMFTSWEEGGFLAGIGIDPTRNTKHLEEQMEKNEFTELEARQGQKKISETRLAMIDKLSTGVMGNREQTEKMLKTFGEDAGAVSGYFSDDADTVKDGKTGQEKFQEWATEIRRKQGAGEAIDQDDQAKLKGMASAMLVGTDTQRESLGIDSKKTAELETLSSALDALNERLGEMAESRNAQTVTFADDATFKAVFDKSLKVAVMEAEN